MNLIKFSLAFGVDFIFVRCLPMGLISMAHIKHFKFSISFTSVLVNCVFLGLCSCHLNFQLYWHKCVQMIDLMWYMICHDICPFKMNYKFNILLHSSHYLSINFNLTSNYFLKNTHLVLSEWSNYIIVYILPENNIVNILWKLLLELRETGSCKVSQCHDCFRT